MVREWTLVELLYYYSPTFNDTQKASKIKDYNSNLTSQVFVDLIE